MTAVRGGGCTAVEEPGTLSHLKLNYVPEINLIYFYPPPFFNFLVVTFLRMP